MTVTQASIEVTEAYRQSQIQLRASAAAELAAIVPLIDIEDIAESWTRLEPIVVRLVETRRAQSIGLSQQFYTAIRRAEQIAGVATPRGAGALDIEQLVRNLRITGPGHLGRSVQLGRIDPLGAMFSNLEGEVSRNVLNGGRGSMLNSVQADRTAVGWVRVTDGNPCAFCAMLASRGPVYKNANEAVAGNFYVGKSGSGREINDFRAHPKCGCVAKPVYSTEDPWPERNQAFREQWDTATAGFGGLDALNAFRRSLAAAT